MKLNKLFFFLILTLIFNCTVYTKGGNCQYCGEWKKHVKIHEKHCHDSPNLQEQTCQFCENQFFRVKKHEKRCPDNPNLQEQTCQFCENQFLHLIEHEKGCPDNPNVQKQTCQFCENQFFRVKSHEKGCPYNPNVQKQTCQFCEKKLLHVKKHEKYCPYNPKIQKQSCQHCGNQLLHVEKHEKLCLYNPNVQKQPCQFCKKKILHVKKHEKRCRLNPKNNLNSENKKRKRGLPEEQSFEPPTKKRKGNETIPKLNNLLNKTLYDDLAFPDTSDSLFTNNIIPNNFDGNSQETLSTLFDTSNIPPYEEAPLKLSDINDEKLYTTINTVFYPYYYYEQNPFPPFGEEDWT